MNTEVKRTFCMVKIVCAYVRILVAQIRKLTVSLKNGSDEVGLSTALWNSTHCLCFLEMAWILFEYMARACWTSFINAMNFSLLAFFCASVRRGQIFLTLEEMVRVMNVWTESGKHYEASRHESILLFPKK